MSLTLRHLIVDESSKGVQRVAFQKTGKRKPSSIDHQITEYLRGERTTFTFHADVRGTPFEEKVWAALRTIPYGTTVTYADLALRAQFPRRYARAVAQAVGRNPLMIIVPCHRVVSSTPKNIGGYAYGVDVKKELLRLEGRGSYECRDLRCEI
jgi:O-6-methylguanine DNA methyltransferase